MARQEFDPVRAVLRALPLILGLALVGGVVLGALLGSREAQYTSETKVLFDVGAAPTSLVRQSGTLTGPDADRALTTQTTVVTSDDVLARVQRAVRLSPPVVRRSTSVELESGTNVLTISATADSPQAARDLASAVATAYADVNKQAGVAQLDGQVQALEPAIAQLGENLNRAGGESAAAAATRGAIQSQLVALAQQQQQLRAAAASYGGQVTLLAAATLPDSASSAGRDKGIAEGVVLGGLLGCLLALALEQRRVRRAPEPAAALPARRRTAAAS